MTADVKSDRHSDSLDGQLRRRREFADAGGPIMKRRRFAVEQPTKLELVMNLMTAKAWAPRSRLLRSLKW
jgi:hypothetical protein